LSYRPIATAIAGAAWSAIAALMIESMCAGSVGLRPAITREAVAGFATGVLSAGARTVALHATPIVASSAAATRPDILNRFMG